MKQNILPSYNELKENYPLIDKKAQFLKDSRELAKSIFLKKEKRLLVFTGPCSIHDEASTIMYAKKIQKLQKDMKNIFLVMRVFFEKPRSLNTWKGFLYDPGLNNTFDIKAGIVKVRKLLLKLTEMNIPISCEVFDPNTFGYFDDLITWAFVGARTSASAFHRHYASSLSFPVGFKNALDGDVDIAINGAMVAKGQQNFVSIDEDGRICQKISDGNHFTHIVLRGSKTSINYDIKSIKNTLDKLNEKKEDLPIIIDCSHGNAQNDYTNQIKAFKYVIKNVYENNSSVIGLMLESNLNEGNQKLNPLNLRFGLSITDPCINFEQTKDLILFAKNYLNRAAHLQS